MKDFRQLRLEAKIIEHYLEDPSMRQQISEEIKKDPKKYIDEKLDMKLLGKIKVIVIDKNNPHAVIKLKPQAELNNDTSVLNMDDLDAIAGGVNNPTTHRVELHEDNPFSSMPSYINYFKNN